MQLCFCLQLSRKVGARFKPKVGKIKELQRLFRFRPNMKMCAYYLHISIYWGKTVVRGQAFVDGPWSLARDQCPASAALTALRDRDDSDDDTWSKHFASLITDRVNNRPFVYDHAKRRPTLLSLRRRILLRFFSPHVYNIIFSTFATVLWFMLEAGSCAETMADFHQSWPLELETFGHHRIS